MNLRFSALAPTLALVFAIGSFYSDRASAATTVGNASVPASYVDGCGDCGYVLNQAFGVAGLSIDTYSFYAGAAGDIIPLLFARVDSGNTATFTVAAIGRTRQATVGTNTFQFDAVQGVNLTTVASYFGFANDNGGVVKFNFQYPANGGTFLTQDHYTPTVGAGFAATTNEHGNTANQLNDRQYSISATAVASVPEPATWAMMLVGFGVAGYAMRRRRTTLGFG